MSHSNINDDRNACYHVENKLITSVEGHKILSLSREDGVFENFHFYSNSN
jgi:hypothetical protein